MLTVKELADRSGISVRTLQYYDEIGLFPPSQRSEAGYRLYEENALEVLRQILFFKEFAIPLKQIKEIMDCPDLDRNQILKVQKEMLVAKRDRLTRLIASIDDILKGDNQMDFTVFDESEIRQMYENLASHFTEEQRLVFIKAYGSMEAFEEQFRKGAACEEAQRNFAKVVEWYGSKEAAKEAAMGMMADSSSEEIVASYQRRIDAIQRKLAESKGKDVGTLEIRSLIGEYDFVAKQLYQMEDVSGLLLEMAQGYQRNPALQVGIDSVYGEGVAAYIGQAIEVFYGRK